MSQSIEETLKERGARYGRFMDHATITQNLKSVALDFVNSRQAFAGHKHPLPPYMDDDQREALDMIFHKIGRILAGDPDYADSWHDIAGYAQLVADRLNGVER
jgi:hypothetical protein